MRTIFYNALKQRLSYCTNCDYHDVKKFEKKEDYLEAKVNPCYCHEGTQRPTLGTT